MPPASLHGAVALITGGASGIGRATAERFAVEGMRVCIVDVDEREGATLAARLDGTFVRADVGDPAQIDAAFTHCIETLGGLDVAFLNAGIVVEQPSLDVLADADYRRAMSVNVDGVVFGVRAAIRSMAGRGGAIVATSSIAGLSAYPFDPIYALTKHAVVGLIRSIAPTLLRQGITANCVNPGITDTNLLSDEAKALMSDADFPLIDPAEIAAAVVHAITSGETGQCWVCQPGREPVAYEFRGVPGPRAPGARGRVPPGIGPQGIGVGSDAPDNR
jgi:NAD(P)-dependent dehydrogenase (short-subunit alcohol dehydrogenase family)